MRNPTMQRAACVLALLAATVLTACGGGGGGGGAIALPPATGLVPNDPATAGPPAEALTPPGGTPDSQLPPRRPESVRCAP
ncbi:hypothetical protein APR50_41955 [Variovorax paradoxus]|jgi:hypothetical protein|uniref:hypothetical protein n=1 Tax=Variovorax TaxID=34072 RepID=UPI0006E6DD82|nr:hypothetical protein APR50_41955 [Variovorax paradoxus]KPU92352.1 hypothetical protein APR52_28740 [Variovorax paradoxus]KPV15650.1 hypothetical protein APR47_44010 [Variovorax paradoxus]